MGDLEFSNPTQLASANERAAAVFVTDIGCPALFSSQLLCNLGDRPVPPSPSQQLNSKWGYIVQTLSAQLLWG